MYLSHMCIYAITYSNMYIGIPANIMNMHKDYDTLVSLHAEVCMYIHRFVENMCIERIVAENDSNIVLTWHVPRRNEGDRQKIVEARTRILHSTQTYMDVRTQDTQTSEEDSTHNVSTLFRPR